MEVREHLIWCVDCMYTRELLKTLTELKEKQVKELIISIQVERSLSCIDSKSCRNTIPLKAHTTAKYAFTEHGCECPFSSPTAESSAVAPTLSRVNSHTFHLQSAAPLRDASEINQVWTR